MKQLLITGFDPFGGAHINPAWEAVRRLPDRVGQWQVQKLQIPTVYGQAGARVLAAAQVLQPEVILCVGQAGGRSAVTPERIAVNIRDARIQDNAGNQPEGQFVVPEGPAAYFATVDVLAIRDAIQNAGIPATVSNSAGAFVCNDVLYTLLHHFRDTSVRVGFLHVPYLPEQGTPNLPLGTIIQALEAAVSAL